MKQIRLKQMSLLNFKGIRDMQVDFGADVTSVTGANGTGKTTLFDAFTWVLFGKDSQGRKNFDIKTIDASGHPIPRIPHEVTIEIEVDGEAITLTRRYNEKWVKRRGQAAEEFTGHEEERLYNEVPCSLKEWNEKIAGICPEAVFKMITSPTCFTSQRPDAQRAMLLKMAGGFSDNEVVAASGQRQDFIELLGVLCGKTIEEYAREIAAKKRRIKAELDALPERIDERSRDNAHYSSTDYTGIRKQLTANKEAVAEIDQHITQASARVEAACAEKEAVAAQLAEVKDAMMRSAVDTLARMSEAYYETERRRAEIGNDIQHKRRKIEGCRQLLAIIEADITRTSGQRAALIAEWKEINAMTLQFSADDFICPTCGQGLDPDNIEKKREQMTANFNAGKSAKLAANKERGMQCSQSRIDGMKAARETAKADIAQAEADIERLKAQLAELPEISKPTDADVEARLKEDEQYQQLTAQAERIKAELDAKPELHGADTAQMQEAKRMLTDSIAELEATLKGEQYQQRNNQRIAELEEQLAAQAEALASLERTEFTISEFTKARISAMEGKINALFGLVRFKMYETQINGGEVETCEAIVGGVPYSSLNSAMRINAGLDIINAICKYQDIAAPIFIDNCESILRPIETIGQQVRLIVADQYLTIK